jgi:acetolactate synthase-1/2/3 large subunit
MRAADFIVTTLEAYGIERLWCVPGESYLALLDALHGSNAVETIVCRHESGAGFMAVAEAKMTGKPAAFAVSRGPGATNASIAMHVAEQDALPVVLLIGQVARKDIGRGAFQEMDYTSFYDDIAKGVWQVNDATELAAVFNEAFTVAQSGTPGPVVIALPEDMLRDECGGAPIPIGDLRPAAPCGFDLTLLGDQLAKAKRPLVMAGSMMKCPGGTAALAAFSERFQVPVALTWKHQELLDNNSPYYAGHLGFGLPRAHANLLGTSDLVIAVGTRLGDVATQNYTMPLAPKPLQPLAHIYPDGAIIGLVYETDMPVACDPVEFLEAMNTQITPDVPANRQAWIDETSHFVQETMTFQPRETSDGVDYGRVIDALSRMAEGDAIIATDAGNFSSWVHRYWKMTPKNTFIGGVAGAMGLGVPGAVAASYLAPDRQVILAVGDGSILMTGNELATAVMLGAKPKIILSNNGTYGTIRQHQEMHFPGRVQGTDLMNPDFSKWAESFGVKAIRIAPGDDVDAKVAEALAYNDGPVLVEVISSQESLSAFVSMSQLAK